MKRLWIPSLVIGAFLWAGNAISEDLPELRSKFSTETAQAEKERLLEEIIKHPEAGPQLLMLAEKTSDANTK